MPAAAFEWHETELLLQLRPLLPGLTIEVVPAIGSTSTALLDRLRLGNTTQAQRLPPLRTEAAVRSSIESRAFNRRAWDVEPVMLIAEHQTAGRGRHDRPWQAAPGASLTFSLALPFEPPTWSGLSLALGVVIADALDTKRSRLGLKWPNDLWLTDASARFGGRKLGGILVETVTAANRRLAVIGIGLNVRPIDVPDSDMAVASLSELRHDIDAPAALALIAGPLVEALISFQNDGFVPFINRFAARDLLHGREVTLSHAEVSRGLAQGVADDGALLVEAGERIHTVHSGEVSVRPVDPDAC